VFPALFDMPGADQPTSMRAAVKRYDDAWVPDLLAGRTMDEVGQGRFDGDPLGTDPHAVGGYITAACAATRGARPRRRGALRLRRRRDPRLPLAAEHRALAPDDVSWRDGFLLSAGRDPHPLEDRH
jgi:hypothetical protein